ncbi:hypothetical protein FHS85_001042 [Rhodoligotrophos appendicifer]|uniref:AAA family ATPase n=1 Tax=Rhodoligotrophos appendicifer TaxID=987056 RepID=UPI00117D741A|nr:AAA family ATPase [Rhodoligotrophos appendicifer]
MRITGITVDGVGRFGSPTSVQGLGAGVNILAASNEAGKSTLFRAVRACLFERHTARSKPIQALLSEGLSLPISVTVAFEHQDEHYEIAKAFLRSPSARLTRGGVEIARNRQADELVWEILGIESGASTIDDAAFGILWVEQGHSFHLPTPSGNAASALNAAIHAEVGTLVGGERARTVLAELKQELSLLVTETGRPKTGGPLQEAQARAASVAQELEQTEQRLGLLELQLGQLVAKRAEQARLTDPAAVAALQADLEAARRELKSAETAAAVLSRYLAEEHAAKAALERAQATHADLSARAGRIDMGRKRIQEFSDALAPLDDQDRAARQALREAREEIAAIDAAAMASDEEERRLQHLGAAATREGERSALEQRRLVLAQIGERQVANEAALKANRATALLVEAMDEAERELARIVAQLEATAPEITIDLAPGAKGRLSIAGRPVERGLSLSAVEPVTIDIADVGRIIVSPSADADASLHRRRHERQSQIAEILEQAGAGSAASVRAAHLRRKELEAEAVGLRAELQGLGIKLSPAQEIERLRGEIAAIGALVEQTCAEAGLDHLPELEALAARRDALHQERDANRARRQVLEGISDAHHARLSNLADERGRLAGTLAEVKARLEADQLLLPDAERTNRLAAAETALHAALSDYRLKSAALEDQRARAPAPLELDRLRNRLERCEAAIEGQKDKQGLLERDIANLEGQVQNAGGDGLGERASALREDLDRITREIDVHQSRVAALALLRETIEACYNEQRDRLNAPLRRHLEPFLNDVFPAAELVLGDGFSIEGLKRNGATHELFTRLSDGTREQIAVLVRLAMGALMCERGNEVPIILDDALVFSDDDRITQMFDALNRAGRSQQVIVLTCRTRAFTALGGRQLSLADR